MKQEAIIISPVNIREHYKVIVGMMQALHVSEKELFDKTADWDDISESYMRHAIECQEECNGTCLVAYVAGEPAGFTFGFTAEDEDERFESYVGEDLYVSDGYIRPEYRRMGLYKTLNTELERIYIAKGVRRIIRYTLTSNTRMQALLERQGFTAVRMVYHKWLSPDGKEVLPLGLTFPEK